MNNPITIEGNVVHIRVPYAENYRAKAIANAKWDRKNRCWSAPLLRGTAQTVIETFRQEEIGAGNFVILASTCHIKVVDHPFPPHEFKNPPMKHQVRALDACYGKRAFAFFMRMRTGKTFTSLMWGERLFLEEAIDAILVIAPTSVKEVWREEVEAHVKTSTRTFVMQAGKNEAAKRFGAIHFDTHMDVIIFGVESMSQGKAYKLALDFAKNHRCLCIVDESHLIKSAKSKRTERITDIGDNCEYRALLTGTPITQGIEDLYAQFNFLAESIIGMRSYFAFRNRYCVMKTFTSGRGTKDEREFTKIVGYDRVRELMELLDPYSIVVPTEEAFPNLPERINKKLLVEPTREQVQAMNGLKSEMRAVQGDDEIEIETALERMLRFQQIAGGHFPYNIRGEPEEVKWGGQKDRKKLYGVKPITGRNPKMDAMMELIENDANDQKYIIWSTMVPEISLIADTLEKKYGSRSVVKFFGGTTPEERTEARHRFQDDPTCRFFVSNQSVGGVGIKLSAADVMIYYSNSFKYMDREQSGERWIDTERVKHMLVIDIVLNHKVDKTIYQALSRKEDVAKYVAEALS